MDSNAITEWATAAGVVVSVLASVGGLVFGIIGTVQARGAKREAAKANKIAEGANTLAAEANDISKDSHTTLAVQAARAAERTDVEFEWRWDTTHPQHVIFQNIGKSEANDVVIQFWFKGAVEANEKNPLHFDGREEHKWEIPGLLNARLAAAQKYEVDRLTGGGYKPIPLAAQTRFRVTWATPLGNIGKFDTDYRDSDLVTPSDNIAQLVRIKDPAPDGSG